VWKHQLETWRRKDIVDDLGYLIGWGSRGGLECGFLAMDFDPAGGSYDT
jgi:hypothetical protein